MDVMPTSTSILNDLIETLKDGQEGFREAAEDVKSPNLQSMFREFSAQRSTFASELQSLARSLGESEPETTGSTAGALHRGWINLKSALTTQDEHAVLAECERGEDSAVAAYRKALEGDGLPSHVRDIVQRQASEVKAAHDRVRAARDTAKK